MATGTDGDSRGPVPWSAEELAAILDHVPTLIGLWDPDLRNEFLNASAYDSLALDSDARGRELESVVGHRAFGSAIEYIRRALAGERQRYTRVVRRSDGREEHYDVDYVPIASADGAANSVIAIGVDVSARVTADVLRRDLEPFLAVVKERERLAGELEDVLAAALVDLVADLTAAADRTPALAPALMQAAALTEAAVEQLHALLHKRSRVGGGVEFAVAAERVADEAGAVLGFAPAFALRGAVERIGPLVAGEVLAVLGEGLSNVARHADSTEVVAAVSVTSNHVTVIVADDGRGLHDVRPGGGMANLLARAERLGGTCEWRPAERSGTLLEWRVPIDRLPGPAPRPVGVGPADTSLMEFPVAGAHSGMPGRSIGVSARRLLGVLDELSSVLVVWDLQERLAFANAAAIAWFGVDSREEVLGRSKQELIPPDVYYAALPFIRAALGGEPQQFERVLPAERGGRRSIRFLYRPQLADGAVVGVVSQIFDVSARLEVQEDLRRSMQLMTEIEERRRIAEDLHDIVIQHLFAAGLRLESALRVAAANRASDGDTVALLHEAIDRVDQAIDRLRESIATLRASPAHPTSSPG